MRKLLIVPLALVVLSVTSGPSHAARGSYWSGSSEDPKTFVVYSGLEMFLPMNIDDGMLKDVKETAASCVGGTCVLAIPSPSVPNSAAYTVDTPNAYGLRLGIFHPIEDFGDLGASIGYLPGVTTSVEFSGKDNTTTSSMDFDRTVSFVRLLGEFRQAYPLGERWSFNPGMGAGVAFGNNKIRFVRANGNFVNFLGESSSWSGFTWEASFGLSLKLEKQELNFTVKYAAFPGYQGDAAQNLPKLNWGSLGFSFGITY